MGDLSAPLDQHQNLLLSGNAGQFARLLKNTRTINRVGKIVSAIGTLLKVSGMDVCIGQQCEIVDPLNNRSQLAEVVGLHQDYALLLPLGDLHGITKRCHVRPGAERVQVRFSEDLLGRVIDGLGNLLDGDDQQGPGSSSPLYRDAPNPLSRTLVTKALPTGIKVIDSMLTVGQGQRVGIFAAAGTGKTTLLGMIAMHTDADVIVVALIGERGREVREFLQHTLGENGRKNTIVVVATSDRPPVERMRAAYTATAIAEGFRDQGKRVVLLVDSVTRFARALREVGLASGEPAVRQGFPPSVFAQLPKLFERAGSNDRGSITAFYTVLVEDEETPDPIAEEVRSILDGHIILSRTLANGGQFPAVDVLASASRVASLVAAEQHQKLALKIRKLLAAYKDIEFLIQVGEYKQGTDPLQDEAIEKHTTLSAFFAQTTKEKASFEQTLAQLEELAGNV